MKKQSTVYLVLVLFFFPIVFTACKKINEASEIGGELIPDNVNTFDTTLSVETYNQLIDIVDDSTSGSLSPFIGTINNDPQFGKTEASLYFELKPNVIRSPFPFHKDSLIGLDSVVLVLGVNSVYGDSTLQQRVMAYEIPTTESFDFSTSYLIRNNYFSLGQSLGPAKTFVPQDLNDSVTIAREGNVANQLRIPLSNSFGQRFLNYDTTNAYQSDSAFKKYFSGFAVVPQNNTTGNALVSFNLSSANTRLTFYVRYKNAGKIDTSMVSFFSTTSSNFANYIKRERSGSQLASAVNDPGEDNLVYLQSSPGSYARVKVPGLSNLTNRVVHRAELIVEQVYDPLSTLFTPPAALYLDVLDATHNKYKVVPFDVSLTPLEFGQNPMSFEIANSVAFGMRGKKTVDQTGNPITVWNFNLSRYIQRVVNKTEPASELRLYAPPYVVKNMITSDGVGKYIRTNANYGIGRVVVGGGNHTTQKMKLRIIYSKL